MLALLGTRVFSSTPIAIDPSAGARGRVYDGIGRLSNSCAPWMRSYRAFPTSWTRFSCRVTCDAGSEDRDRRRQAQYDQHRAFALPQRARAATGSLRPMPWCTHAKCWSPRSPDKYASVFGGSGSHQCLTPMFVLLNLECGRAATLRVKLENGSQRSRP